MSTVPVLMFDSRRLGLSGAVRRQAIGRTFNPEVAGERQPAGRSGALRRPLCNSAKLRLVQARAAGKPAAREADAPLAKTYAPEVYREHTEGLLRRYLKMSLEVGRTPSWMGSSLFRTGVTSRNSVYSFEDVVVFVCDVEKCVDALEPTARKLVVRMGMQEYTAAEMAPTMGTSERSVVRRYLEALDAFTSVLIDRGVMKPFLL